MPLTSAQLTQQVLPFAGLVLVSFAYLTIDLYQQVNSLKAIWSTVSFWMLWLAFSFLDLLAFDLLYTKSRDRIVSLTSSPFLGVSRTVSRTDGPDTL
jgi:hypothetical protein